MTDQSTRPECLRLDPPVSDIVALRRRLRQQASSDPKLATRFCGAFLLFLAPDWIAPNQGSRPRAVG